MNASCDCPTCGRPRALDLFCGAGGASMGWHRAGYCVTGVDHEDHPSYPFTFVKADALDVLTDTHYLQTFDLVGMGPPCQELTRLRHLRTAQGREVRSTGRNLIGVVRELVEAAGVPYVIENVPDAIGHLRTPYMLCGWAFGLRVRRHRLFETSFPVLQTPCLCVTSPRPVGIYGKNMGDRPPGGGRVADTIEEARQALGIDWMRWRSRTQEWQDLVEAIPPAYTEYLGEWALQAAGVDGAALSELDRCEVGA